VGAVWWFYSHFLCAAIVHTGDTRVTFCPRWALALQRPDFFQEAGGPEGSGSGWAGWRRPRGLWVSRRRALAGPEARRALGEPGEGSGWTGGPEGSHWVGGPTSDRPAGGLLLLTASRDIS
jgi:hypothetical protein